MKTANNNRTSVKNLKFLVLFVLFTFSVSGAAAQNTPAAQTNTTEVSVAKDSNVIITDENTIASASMDFAIWFAGNGKVTNDTNNTATSFSKKALINSGVKTTNVLIRSILKKVSSQGNSIA